MQDREGRGPAGMCVCPKCGEMIPHRAGVPCVSERCPKCGAGMLRYGSHHHKLLMEKGALKE